MSAKEGPDKGARGGRMGRRAFVAGTGALVAAAAVGTGVAVSHASMLDRIVNPTSTDITDEQRADAELACRQVAARVEAQGAVLLRNPALPDGQAVLPLPASVRKVNVFGWASTQWLGGGSGSGGIKACDTTLIDALEGYGIECNAELTRMYGAFQGEREYAYTLHAWPEQTARLYEPAIDDERYYTQALLERARAFSDVAILVVGRLAGESSDLLGSQFKCVERAAKPVRDDSRHTLALSAEEEGLLAYLAKTYERVVVVLNVGNVMELGSVETCGGNVACLLAGYTGQYAASALPELLWGAQTPSGRTCDTWAYDLTTAPSWANSGKWGVGAYEGAQGLYPADGTQCGNLGEAFTYDQVSFVDYAEGLYVGYRWYETADAEGFWDGVSNEHGEGYEGVVQYPFGFGLSYTTFAWDVLTAPRSGRLLVSDSELSWEVEVTNTGGRPGADVVQAYAELPYVRGQIEKPSLVLAAYGRTRVLEPGESQVLSLSVRMRDLASYDYADANGNGFVGYELDAGVYTFSLRHDAHTPSEAAGAVSRCRLSHPARYPQDERTGVEVTNRFTGEASADGVGIDGVDTGQGIAWLTRADFAQTFPKGPSPRPIPESVAALNLPDQQELEELCEADAPQATMGAFGTLAVERDGELTELGRALGADFADGRWGQLLDQVSPREAVALVCDAYSGTVRMPSVGKEATRDADGPAQMGGFTGFSVGVGLPCPWVLAQTWDPALAREAGRALGRQAGQLGYSGWYAPAANLHRSPVGGRNYEYCSEDPLITGDICANMVVGARQAGIYAFVKHLICNDGEAHIYRDGVYTWLTEQALRELYLAPFRRLVEDFGALGLMSSYNRLGAVWAGGSRALITDVLRGEWGFAGAVITDYSDHPAYMNGTQALLAGSDLWMAGTKLAAGADAPALRCQLRRVVRDVLALQLDARVENERYVQKAGDPSMLKPRIEGALPLWPAAVGVADAVALGLFAWALVRLRKGGKDEAAPDCP